MTKQTVNYSEMADRFAELLRSRAKAGADIKELTRIANALYLAQKQEIRQERQG